jgi:hypothetical protein
MRKRERRTSTRERDDPTQDRYPTAQPRPSGLTLGVVVSLLGTALSLTLSIATFRVSYRPTLGVVLIADNFNDPKGPPAQLQFRFDIKNTGALPAIVRRQMIRPELRRGKETVELPHPQPQGRDVLILPGHHVESFGGLDRPLLGEVLAGSAQFDVLVDVVYQPTGLLGWFEYHLRTRQRFNPTAWGVRWLNVETTVD